MHIYFSVELPERPKAIVLYFIQKKKEEKKTHEIGSFGERPIFFEILTFWQFPVELLRIISTFLN